MEGEARVLDLEGNALFQVTLIKTSSYGAALDEQAIKSPIKTPV